EGAAVVLLRHDVDRAARRERRSVAALAVLRVRAREELVRDRRDADVRGGELAARGRDARGRIAGAADAVAADRLAVAAVAAAGQVRAVLRDVVAGRSARQARVHSRRVVVDGNGVIAALILLARLARRMAHRALDALEAPVSTERGLDRRVIADG